MDEFEMSIKQALSWQPQVRLTRCDISNSLKFITSNEYETCKKPRIDESRKRYLYQSDSHESDCEDDSNLLPASSSLSRRVSSYHPSEEDRQRKQESLERCKSKLGPKKKSRKSSAPVSVRSVMKKINDYEFAPLGRPTNTAKSTKNSLSALKATREESEAASSRPESEIATTNEASETGSPSLSPPSLLREPSSSKPESETVTKNEASETGSPSLSPPSPLREPSSSKPESKPKIKNEVPKISSSSPNRPLQSCEPVHEIKVEIVSDIWKNRSVDNNGTDDEVPVNEERLTEVKITVETTVISPPKKFLRIKTPDEVNETVGGSCHTAKTTPDEVNETLGGSCHTAKTKKATIAPFIVNSDVPSVFRDEISRMEKILNEMLAKYYRFSEFTKKKKKSFLQDHMTLFCKIFEEVINSSPDNKLGETILFEVAKNITTKQLVQPLSDMYEIVPHMLTVFPEGSKFKVLQKIANRHESAGQKKSSDTPPPENSIQSSQSRKNHSHQPSADQSPTEFQAQSMAPRAACENTQSQKVPQAAHSNAQPQSVRREAAHLNMQPRFQRPQTAHLNTQPCCERPQAAYSNTQPRSERPQATRLNIQPQSVGPHAAHLSTQATYQPQSMMYSGADPRLLSQQHHNTTQRGSAHSFYEQSNISSSYSTNAAQTFQSHSNISSSHLTNVAQSFQRQSNISSSYPTNVAQTFQPQSNISSTYSRNSAQIFQSQMIETSMTTQRTTYAPVPNSFLPPNVSNFVPPVTALTNMTNDPQLCHFPASTSAPHAPSSGFTMPSNEVQLRSSTNMEILDQRNPFEEAQQRLRDFYLDVSASANSWYF